MKLLYHKDNNALQEAYTSESYNLELKAAKFGLILSFLLTISFSLLDAIFYPDQYYELLAIRILFGFIVILLYVIFLYLKKKQRDITVLIYVTAWSIATSIAAMIAITDGANSTYYAGLNYILIGMFLFPSNFLQTSIISFGTVLIYCIGCFVHFYYNPSLTYDWLIFANNIFFLVGTGIISSISSHFHHAKRFEAFRLNYELEQRNKELAELDRLKSDFFANVSHELRTPLTLIIAPIQDILLNATKLPERVVQSLEVVETNTLRLLRLVNDILDIIRLEEGHTDFAKKPMSLNDHLSGIVRSMNHFAQKENIRLHNQLATENLVISGDEVALEKVFINLIGNAIKFTQSGGSIWIKTQKIGDCAIVTVEDNGIGIDEKDLPYIFDRFRQADGSTTRKHQGLGLGLALVKEMIENHEGQITVKSTYGVGTVFALSLPLARLGDRAQHEAISLPNEPTSLIIKEPQKALHLVSNNDNKVFQKDEHNKHLKKILIVDDEPDMLNFLVSMLDPYYHVVRATNGLQALEMVRKTSPDLIVLDLMLPEIDGLEVCQKIKQNPETRGIKIMLLTARVDEKSKLSALERGADDFLTKPFSSIEVKTRIKNLVNTAELEHYLKDQNQELKQTLTQLKQTEAKLIHSEKLNSLGIMAAGLLHEINNPINYSHFALQTVQHMPEIQENDELKDAFSDIDEGLQRVRKIVTDLKTFAYQNEAQSEQEQEFSMSAAIEHALRFTAHQRKGIVMNVHIPDESKVVGLETHIVQVLVNLILNAVSALRSIEAMRTPHLSISVVHDHKKCLIKVRDNGTGISEENMSRIFDPFYSTRDVGEGLGLGLSISHTIIANHGGELTVRSQLGEWTEFRFDLKQSMSYMQENMSYDVTAYK